MKGSLYIPGTTWLHRQRAGIKLLALAMSGGLLVLVHSLLALSLVLLGVLFMVYASGISLNKIWRQLRPLFWFMLLLTVYTIWAQSLSEALEMILRLSSLILAALVISMTTPITQMMRVMEWLLQPFVRVGWVNADKVSLAFGLTLRLIPELSVQWNEIREAQMARGIRPGIVSMLVPMLVRTINRAQDIAEAIDARAVK